MVDPPASGDLKSDLRMEKHGETGRKEGRKEAVQAGNGLLGMERLHGLVEWQSVTQQIKIINCSTVSQ